jgi:hypothetical protein
LKGIGTTAVSQVIARNQIGYIVTCTITVIPTSRGKRQYALTAMTKRSTVIWNVTLCSSGRNSYCSPKDSTPNKYQNDTSHDFCIENPLQAKYYWRKIKAKQNTIFVLYALL